VTHRRRLQCSDANSGGIAVDTNAIVLSVLVGAAGYVVQAHTARRAERAQEQQAMEMQTAEQARQREHQMTTAQIERTHKALDQCIRPVGNDIWALIFARSMVVQQIVSKLDVSHPDAVERMLSFITTSKRHPDGTVTSATSGKLLWTPNPPPELTRAVAKPDMAAPSAAAYMIAGHDALLCLSKPFCFEMPDAILDIIAAEPTGEIAEMYRGYVRHTLMPLFRRVANTLQEYSAYVELPPKDWLEKMYPDISWRSSTNSIFIQVLYEHTLSFERSLVEWSDGNFKSVRPGMAQPIGAINRTLVWSQERAQAKQAELIGMTAVNEIDHSLFSRVEVSTAAFEIEE
jgi:type II secretory pathway pseudopilin PulG